MISDLGGKILEYKPITFCVSSSVVNNYWDWLMVTQPEKVKKMTTNEIINNLVVMSKYEEILRVKIEWVVNECVLQYKQGLK